MSTTTPTPATTPIPVQLSEPEFEALILPHLSMPKRGPKCKLGYYRVFNLILWGLYTGMQWKSLPVPHDAQGKPEGFKFCLGTMADMRKRAMEPLAVGALRLAQQRPRIGFATTGETRGVDIHSGYYNDIIIEFNQGKISI